MKLRLWCELLPLADLLQPGVRQLLHDFDCTLLLRADPQRLADPELARVAAGIPDLGLWLLLDEHLGYWPSERNARHVRRAVEQALRLPIAWLAIDLEPPIWQVRQPSWRHAFRNVDPHRFEQARLAYRDIIADAHDAGVKVLCAAHDYVAEDVWLGRPAMQDRHEAPVLSLPWDVISVMLYGSLTPGDRLAWLYDRARLLRSLGVGASVGLTASGVLGNEPHYTSPDGLRQDAAVLRAAGIQDFAIYSLEGILASRRPGSWLEAVRDAPPRVPSISAEIRRQRTKRRLQAALWAAYSLVVARYNRQSNFPGESP